jgi:hypothetical protein
MVIGIGGDAGPEFIPVEYKQTRRRIGHHLRRQLVAYGLMLEQS